MIRSAVVLAGCLVAGYATTVVAEEVARQKAYAELIAEDNPAAYWSFAETEGKEVGSFAGGKTSLPGQLEQAATLGKAGPRSQLYPLFDDGNRALTLTGAGAFVRVADPGQQSILDFDNGDSITIEAWVKPNSVAEDQQVYIVGKGRTNNKGFPRDNQNYALRLRGMSGTARVSFLFRKAATAESPEAFHRWNSDLGFHVDGSWHHVAIVYTFGKPEHVRAYVDGQQSGGSWDMGGPTSDAPIVDNDEFWIGSASGGNPGNTFQAYLINGFFYTIIPYFNKKQILAIKISYACFCAYICLVAC